MSIGVSAEDEGAKRTHEKACAESHEREHERAERAIAGEEGFPDGSGVVAEYHEVVHLQEITAGDADHGPDLGFTFLGSDHLGLFETIFHL